MNDNEKSFSNTPYKATGNLNTMIGNPNININSAVTSNILEGNDGIPVPSVGDSSKTNIVESNDIEVTGPVSNFNPLASSMLNSNLDEGRNNSVQKEEPIQDFINKTNETSGHNNHNVGVSSIEPIINVQETKSSSYATNINTVESNRDSNVNQVRYENVYQTDKKNKPKNSFKIPNEFKTAIFVVLILLIVLSCFEPIYDFFRNLNIFG